MKYLVLLALLASCNVSAQDDDETKDATPDFYYTVQNQLETSKHFAFGLEPLGVGYMGSYVLMSVGAAFDVADLMDKFSFGGNINYGYVNYSTNKNKVDYSSSVVNEKLRSFDFNTNAGYTFKSVTKTDDWSVTLKSSGRTDYVATMPVKSTTNYSVVLGFNVAKFYSVGEPLIEEMILDANGTLFLSEMRPNVVLGQKQSSISLGVKRRVSANSIYETTKYGTVRYSLEASLSGELLIGLPNALPTMNTYLYQDQYYPNEVSSTTPASAQVQTNLEGSYKRLPIGIKVGYIQNVRRTAGLGWNVSGSVQPGLYPGSIQSMTSLVRLKIGVTYNFLFKF